jgi:hypothetical protein
MLKDQQLDHSLEGRRLEIHAALINSAHPQTLKFLKQKNKNADTQLPTRNKQHPHKLIIKILIHKKHQHPQNVITTKTTPKHRHKKKKREREREKERERESVCVCVFLQQIRGDGKGM